MPMTWPSISSSPSSTWFVLYVAISLQLMSCHTTKEVTTDKVQLHNNKLEQTNHQNIALDIWDICRLDIFDSVGKPTATIIKNRQTKAKINAADTTQVKTNDTIKSHQAKATRRNVSAIPEISENWYHIIVFVCACIMLVAILRISKI